MFSIVLVLGISALIGVHGEKLYRRQEQCEEQCGNIVAATTCTNFDCLCPTVLVSAGACSSCLAAVNATEAAAVGSVLSACASPTGVCAPQCAIVLAAATACSTNLYCLCPTILASGPSCIACLTESKINPTDASLIASYIATDCQGPASTTSQSSSSSPVSTITSTTGSTASSSLISTTPTGSSQLSSSSSPSIASKSEAWSSKFNVEVFGYTQMIMVLAIVAGLLSIFV